MPKSGIRKNDTFLNVVFMRGNKKKNFAVNFFAINLVIISLQGGIDPSADEDDILVFCALNIQNLNLNGQMMEDGSMNVDIGLHSFTMDDQRKNAKVVN